MRSGVIGVGGLLVALITLSIPPASAGGAFLDFDGAYAVGERVTASEIVSLSLDNRELGTIEDGPFYAFLVDTPLDGYPVPLPERSIELGPVLIERRSAQAGVVTVDFIVPEIEPGEYQVFVCNSPCRKPLGDLLPSVINIASDQAEAHLMGRVHRLESKFSLTEPRLNAEVRWQIRRFLGPLKERDEVLAGRLDEFEDRLATLEDRVDSTKVSNREESPLSAVTVTGLLVLLLGMASLLRVKEPSELPTFERGLSDWNRSRGGRP